MKNLLLTGATGHIGINVLKELLTKEDHYNIRVFALDTKNERKILKPFSKTIEIIWGDLRNLDDIQRATDNIDVVIHLAAIIPPLADRFPSLAHEVNVLGTKNLVKSMENSRPNSKLIFTSSVAVYGDRLQNHWIEIGDPLVPSPGDYYAETKIAAEKIVQNSKLKWTIFRLSGILHRNIEFDPIMFHVPLDTKIEFCLAEDTAYALVNAIENKEIWNKIYNLGGGKKCQVIYKDFIVSVLKVYGISQSVIKDHYFAKKGFHCGYYKDGYKLNELLNFQRGSLQDYYCYLEKDVSKWKKLIYRSIPTFLIRKYFERMSLKAFTTDNNVTNQKFN